MLQIVGLIAVVCLVAALVVMRKKDRATSVKSSSRI